MSRRRTTTGPADLRLVRQDRSAVGAEQLDDLRRRRSGGSRVTVIATWVLLRTRAGNWIFAVGGAQTSARAGRRAGLPDQDRPVHDDRGRRLAGRHARRCSRPRPCRATTGVGQEFIYIICAVVGGCLLTGGYGSAIGAALGALIYGMVSQGIVYAGWDNDWLYAFLGVMLLGAVLVNNWVKYASGDSAMTTDDRTTSVGSRRRPTSPASPALPGRRRGTRSSRSTTSASPTATSSRCATSRRRSTPARSPACSATTAPASRRSSRSWPARTSTPTGKFLVDGDERQLRLARARRWTLGIATVYQDLAVVPLMPVWRNFFLGSEITKGSGPLRRLDIDAMKQITKTELAAMGIDLRDVDQPIGTLSGGERQCVAIARAVYFGARVLILDEPTAALGVKQSGVVLKYIAKARDRGLGVIFITHNPHHAYPVGDRFMLLRRGRSMGDFPKAEMTLDELVADDGRRRRARGAEPRARARRCPTPTSPRRWRQRSRACDTHVTGRPR